MTKQDAVDFLGYMLSGLETEAAAVPSGQQNPLDAIHVDALRLAVAALRREVEAEELALLTCADCGLSYQEHEVRRPRHPFRKEVKP